MTYKLKDEIQKYMRNNPPRKCLICQTPYIPKNYWQKYCSQDCKLLAYAKSKVDLKIAGKSMLIFGILLFLFMAVVRSVFAACNADSSLPDQYCTPGSVLYGVTKQTLCTPGYSLTVRDVSNT